VKNNLSGLLKCRSSGIPTKANALLRKAEVTLEGGLGGGGWACLLNCAGTRRESDRGVQSRSAFIVHRVQRSTFGVDHHVKEGELRMKQPIYVGEQHKKITSSKLWLEIIYMFIFTNTRGGLSIDSD